MHVVLMCLVQRRIETKTTDKVGLCLTEDHLSHGHSFDESRRDA